VVPGLQDGAEHASAHFMNRQAYVSHVLDGHPVDALPDVAAVVHRATGASIVYGLGAAALAALVALFGLGRRRLPEAVEPPLNALKAVHSGVIGDYVMWLTLGTAVLGGIWLLALTRA
jgi:multicomponent Na+:H+ antiporter subunit D